METARQQRGKRNYLAGLAAEGAVEGLYARRGGGTLDRRWRGAAGEIDLIVRDGESYVFVEVKQSRTHAAALARVSRRQAERIMASACEYLANRPGGEFAEMRFDVATVDGAGRVEILENAFAA
ncbi:hypothetical protein OG2516_16981 [Oceanicola granulosus HTCC2516]|uniref:UPF0102 protein OG2516_16981 n=1 Tax=Oceanicola granulosus (strain ATCC BAA-861 / DSM 15982 / KCTC 12143 / HTCC2516) TaxID=314256 RepID=Q2CFP7_OCEGH|nr:YraN family protein [Oceanicola granulosus]EAR51435.1 hypothetical protein OG2516_16981 [Oceanicola granulosus HTCC2516]